MSDRGKALIMAHNPPQVLLGGPTKPTKPVRAVPNSRNDSG